MGIVNEEKLQIRSISFQLSYLSLEQETVVCLSNVSITRRYLHCLIDTALGHRSQTPEFKSRRGQI